MERFCLPPISDTTPLAMRPPRTLAEQLRVEYRKTETVAVAEDPLAIILRKSKVDPLETVEEPPTCLEFLASDGEPTPIGTLGNISLVLGKAKSRKTYFISLLISALLSEGAFQKKIRGCLPSNKRKVLLFDTEQARYHVLNVARRIQATSKEMELANLDVHCLRPYNTEERLSLIEYAIVHTEGLGGVVIDGIRDLVSDINSADQATDIANRLLKWSEERGIHIIVVLHQNKGNTDARGHLGTELINKAETVLSVTKDQQNPQFSVVAPEFTRGKDFPPFVFEVDFHDRPLIDTCYTPVPEKGQRKKAFTPNSISDDLHLQVLRTVFARTARPRYGELQSEIQIAFQENNYSLGENKAAQLIPYYREMQWLVMNPEKLPGEKCNTYRFNPPL